MYRLALSKRCRRQLKRLRGSARYPLSLFDEAVELLLLSMSLPVKFRDHALKGQLVACRECHIRPDWLLIYCVHADLGVVELVATGSHSELFNE